MKEININHSFRVDKVVEESLLAKSVGSGDVAVFATPMMIALMEESASKALAEFLDEGETSVGININSSHVAATPVAMGVHSIATITEVDGKKISFKITAYDEAGVIGEATHQRFVVNKAKFEQKASEKTLA